MWGLASAELNQNDKPSSLANVDLEGGYIYILSSLHPDGSVGPTKGRKKSRHKLPSFLIPILKAWKEKQANELASIGITGLHGDQFVFTYNNSRGQVNVPVYADYLNERLKRIHIRHPELAHANPHKLRHTFGTLATEGGASLESVQTTMTHSNPDTTKIYISTISDVDLTSWNVFKKRIQDEKQKGNS